MHRKMLCLLLCGVLAFPLAGCELTINGKQIFSTEHQEEEHIKEEKKTYSMDEIIEAIKIGKYSLKIDGEVVDTFIVEDIMNKIYEEPYWTGSLIDEHTVIITVYNKRDDRTKYISISADLDTGELQVVELLSDKLYTDDEAKEKFTEMLVEISDKVEKKQETEKKEEKKTEKKKETKKSDSQEGGMTFESQAPYGRCLGCNCALTKSGAYCSQCNELTGFRCATCQVPLRHYHELGKWEDDFCSNECMNHWYEEYARTNQKAYCMYCGKETTVGMTEQWFGCCSEICAVNYEGEQYEKYLKETGQWQYD